MHCIALLSSRSRNVTSVFVVGVKSYNVTGELLEAAVGMKDLTLLAYFRFRFDARAPPPKMMLTPSMKPKSYQLPLLYTS